MISARGLRTVLVVLVALGLAVGVAPLAHAYPDMMFRAQVSEQVVFSGQTFEASSSANVECAWTHRWRGKPQRATGTELTSTWTAPRVQRETVIPLHFSCAYSAAAGAGTQVPTREVWQRTIDVTVLPAGSAKNPVSDEADTQNIAGTMPNTGGPDVLFLVAGLLLLLAGAVAVRTARGRALEHDVDPTQG